MRSLTGLLSGALIAAALALAVSPAVADDDEGKIARINEETLTITLDNGNSYKLSAEFDVEALSVGVDVVLAYDTIEGEKTVTDLVIYE